LITSCRAAPAVVGDQIIGPFGRILPLFDRILLQRRWFLDNGVGFSHLLEQREKWVTGLLFYRHRGEEIASMCVMGQVGPFCHIWFILNFNQQNISYWRNFFAGDLRISSNFLRIFSNIFIFLKKSNLNSKIHWF
jgi:hypothetical protein